MAIMTTPHEWTLSNGLRVIYAHYPNAATFAVCALSRAGSMYEEEGEEGCAHFLEHVVLDATKNYPDEESLSRLIEDVGGRNNASTGREYVKYYSQVLAEDAERAFEHTAEVMIRPLIREESVVKQKGIITEEVNLYLTHPQEYAFDELMTLLYPHSRIGGLITGTAEEVAAIEREELLSYHSRTYTARNTVLSICGSLDPDKARSLSEQYFADLPKGEEVDIPPARTRYAEEHFRIANWADVKQANVFIAIHAPHLNEDEMFAWDILASLLGGGQLSRLFMTIRERNHLAYSVGTGLSTTPTFGFLSTYIGLADKNISRALDLYKQEINDLAEHGPRDDEFRRVKKTIRASLLFKSDKAASTASALAYAKMFSPSLYTFKDVNERYESLTLHDIHAAAQKLRDAESYISVVGNSVSEDNLKPLLA